MEKEHPTHKCQIIFLSYFWKFSLDRWRTSRFTAYFSLFSLVKESPFYVFQPFPHFSSTFNGYIYSRFLDRLFLHEIANFLLSFMKNEPHFFSSRIVSSFRSPVLRGFPLGSSLKFHTEGHYFFSGLVDGSWWFHRED